MIDLINPKEYHNVSKKLRAFFEEKGFIEVPTQSRLSILAACEDPSTIGTFQYTGKVWPLPQTGQMWLETELLKHPDWPGVFCQSTSYRQEADPIPGRHNLIFPMFEFEAKGTRYDLYNLEIELLDFLGFSEFKTEENEIKGGFDYWGGTYEGTANNYNTKDISATIEEKIWKDISPVFFLQDFPEYTHPFWNMRRSEWGAHKIDVILFGQETIGSAEREIDPDIMLERFNTISNGEYAKLLYAQFGRDRVMKELGEFLDFDFFNRFGGGIGMTRMIRAMKLLENEKKI